MGSVSWAAPLRWGALSTSFGCSAPVAVGASVRGWCRVTRFSLPASASWLSLGRSSSGTRGVRATLSRSCTRGSRSSRSTLGAAATGGRTLRTPRGPCGNHARGSLGRWGSWPGWSTFVATGTFLTPLRSSSLSGKGRCGSCTTTLFVTGCTGLCYRGGYGPSCSTRRGWGCGVSYPFTS